MPQAFHIDATARTISAVDLPDGSAALPVLHRLVGGYIEGAYYWPTGDVLWVDEEGLMKQRREGFLFLHLDTPLVGSGVVVGREVEGEQYAGGYTTLAPAITLPALRRLVAWFTMPG